VGVAGTIQLISVARSSVTGRVLTRSLAISTLLALVFFFFQGASVYGRDVKIIDEEMVASAHWIQNHIPTDQTLAIHDIGAVGYFAPRPMLDLAGLVSPEIVPFILDENSLWQWLQQKNARYLMAFPNQIPGGDIHNPHLCPVFTTGGKTAIEAGGSNMTIYELTWNGVCPNN
jgi:hypothetical protein